jgi:hypothetical protein
MDIMIFQRQEQSVEVNSTSPTMGVENGVTEHLLGLAIAKMSYHVYSLGEGYDMLSPVHIGFDSILSVCGLEFHHSLVWAIQQNVC